MEVVFPALAALCASVLTFFSGFGLGTILSPVLILFMPVPAAIAITALVHGINSLFKMLVMIRQVRWDIWLSFGLPAMIAALPGAWLLDRLSQLPALATYRLLDAGFSITPVKLVMGLLLVVFATTDRLPLLDRFVGTHRLSFAVGGIFSGFFGGLSGHQGAFRSAFLRQAQLSAPAFVATAGAIAAAVDTARLAVYSLSFSLNDLAPHQTILVGSTVAALAGTTFGSLWLHKITMQNVQRVISIMLYGLGGALILGLI